jgi:hypothetical protein
MIAVVTEFKSNAGNLNNIRCEINKYFRNLGRGYLKDRIIELETNSKSGDIRYMNRGINEFKKNYKPRTW